MNSGCGKANSAMDSLRLCCIWQADLVILSTLTKQKPYARDWLKIHNVDNTEIWLDEKTYTANPNNVKRKTCGGFRSVSKKAATQEGDGVMRSSTVHEEYTPGEKI